MCTCVSGWREVNFPREPSPPPVISFYFYCLFVYISVTCEPSKIEPPKRNAKIRSNGKKKTRSRIPHRRSIWAAIACDCGRASYAKCTRRYTLDLYAIFRDRGALYRMTGATQTWPTCAIYTAGVDSLTHVNRENANNANANKINILKKCY